MKELLSGLCRPVTNLVNEAMPRGDNATPLAHKVFTMDKQVPVSVAVNVFTGIY
jgi:hypothetical protein